MKYTFDHKHYNEDYTPKSCYKCEHTKFTQHTCATDAGHVSEYELKCANCFVRVAYWGYGYYDPCFAVAEL